MKFNYYFEYTTSGSVKITDRENDDFKLKMLEKDGVLKLTLLPAVPIEIKKFYATVPYVFADGARFLANGFQSWTDTKEFVKAEQMPDIGKIGKTPAGRAMGMQYVGDYTFVPEKTCPGVFHSHGFAYVKTKDVYDFFGSLTDRTGYTVITADMNRNTLCFSKDLEGTVLTEPYEILSLYFAEGSYEAVFDGYFAAMGIQPRTDQKIKGYTSWYNYYQNISHKVIARDLNAIVQCGDVDIFQVDDGYQTAVGDWLSTDSKKFPFGMQAVADAIHAKGLQAGLWLAPFGAQKDSFLVQKHPGWLVKDKNGRPICVGGNWGGFYALDIYNEEARAYIKKVFDTVLRIWGFDLVKLDFLYAASILPRNGKTRGEIAYDSIDFLRECVGDKKILGCGVQMLPCFGKVEYMRIGADMALSWQHNAVRKRMHREDVSTPNAIHNSVYRRGLNGRAFLCDPDVFLLRRNNISFTENQQALLAKFIKLFGSVLFTSDDVSTYGEMQKDLFADTLTDNAKITSIDEAGEEVTVTYQQEGWDGRLQFNVNTGEIIEFN